MTKKLFTLLFICSALVSQEYIYKFRNNGIPKTRTNSSTGAVEIYTNLHRIKATEQVLHKIHQKSYSSMTYKAFMKKTKAKYPKLLFSAKNDNFVWVTHSDYANILSLTKIDIFTSK